MLPQVSVLIVSYNTREMTLRCLQTLFDHSESVTTEVIVVDNASCDGSVEAIRERFPTVRIHASEENLGFGRANNIAMEMATAPWFLLLNSDAFVHAGALQSLLEYSNYALHKGERRVGVVAPRLLNRDGTHQMSHHDFVTPLGVWRENLGLSSLRNFIVKKLRTNDVIADEAIAEESRAVDWAIGACLLVRREVWQQVGGFDERFFMYQEEADWQRRITAAGWEIRFLPSAQVTHWGGASGNASENASENETARVSQHFFESLDFYQWKHYGWRGLLSLRAAMTVGCAARTAAWTLASLAPPLRSHARLKSRTMAKLLLRQAGNWNLPQIRGAKQRNPKNDLNMRD